MTDPPRPTPPGYWLPDDIWQLINERIMTAKPDTTTGVRDD